MNLKEAKKKAKEARRKDKFAMRSCGHCNPAHEYLHDEQDPLLFVCFAECGCWYYGKWNLTKEKRVNFDSHE